MCYDLFDPINLKLISSHNKRSHYEADGVFWTETVDARNDCRFNK